MIWIEVKSAFRENAASWCVSEELSGGDRIALRKRRIGLDFIFAGENFSAETE